MIKVCVCDDDVTIARRPSTFVLKKLFLHEQGVFFTRYEKRSFYMLQFSRNEFVEMIEYGEDTKGNI